MSSILTPGSTNPQARVWERITAQDRRIAALERATFAAPVKNGAPAPAEGTDGSLALDASAPKLWIKRGGVWQYVALT